jgi:DNA-binding NarL/FixJ family response regulator
VPLCPTGEERLGLREWARHHKVPRRLARRARIVLECAAGRENKSVARNLRISQNTVGTVPRLLQLRLEGLRTSAAAKGCNARDQSKKL